MKCPTTPKTPKLLENLGSVLEQGRLEKAFIKLEE